jgi:predicted TIM-barrel fold metal-dependent hydrolase
MDVHTHFLRDDTRLQNFVRARETVGKAGWNPALAGKEQTLDDLKYPNWRKEIYLDSDTKVALISGSGSEDRRDWFLTNEMKFDAREKVNKEAGTRRCLSHAIFMPGMPGWLDEADRVIATLKPDSWKGYTVGDNTNKQLSRHPWRMDDEKLLYPFYEKILKAGHNIVCVHKGLYPPSTEKDFPHLLPHAKVDDVGKAAKDWPQINFVVYHSAFRWTPGSNAHLGLKQFETTGRVEWTSDLAEIPAKYGVSNVYADLGQIFAQTTVVEPRLCAALMGMLVKGMGADHVVWGTDAVWTGSPQWQIEALRRLEIPEDMQKKYGYAPLGPADGPIKTAIFGENSAKMYKYDIKKAGLERDSITFAKAEYEKNGPARSNLRYGYVVRG